MIQRSCSTGHRDLLAAPSSVLVALEVFSAPAPLSHLYCRALCWVWFCLGLSGHSFYSQLARQDHWELHFLFVLNEQLLFFLPYSGNHRIPNPEAEWQNDGDRIHLSHVCSACGASPAYALLYRGKVQRFPGAPRVFLGNRFPLHQGLGLPLHGVAARQRVMPASS